MGPDLHRQVVRLVLVSVVLNQAFGRAFGERIVQEPSSVDVLLVRVPPAQPVLRGVKSFVPA
jgi:hypothetical protein